MTTPLADPLNGLDRAFADILGIKPPPRKRHARLGDTVEILYQHGWQSMVDGELKASIRYEYVQGRCTGINMRLYNDDHTGSIQVVMFDGPQKGDQVFLELPARMATIPELGGEVPVWRLIE